MSLPLLLLYGVVPLALFVLVDIYAGVRWAVGAAIVGALGDVVLTRVSTGEWDVGSLVALALVAALGLLSIKLDNSLFFKLQPSVMALMCAATLAYFQFVGTPLMERYGPLIRQALPADMRPTLDRPEFRQFMDGTLVWLIGFFLAYGALMVFVALRLSNVAWLAMRGVGVWALLFLFMLVRVVVLVVHGGLGVAGP